MRGRWHSVAHIITCTNTQAHVHIHKMYMNMYCICMHIHTATILLDVPKQHYEPPLYGSPTHDALHVRVKCVLVKTK